MRKNTIDLVTLGCSKNLVDSEQLIRQLEKNGYSVTHACTKECNVLYKTINSLVQKISFFCTRESLLNLMFYHFAAQSSKI